MIRTARGAHAMRETGAERLPRGSSPVAVPPPTTEVA
ncbi:hypothetical protein MPTA5024_03800 [Microbispora sp. ATCC PTA-5024]|nr:hypothetical protein MPTA5024_03800 [Microbispora sp. ATCC PTA-5024]